jgi:hypothetical protein
MRDSSGIADLEDIAHAYAVVPSKTQPGRFYSVHLEGVLAEKVTILEGSGRAEPAIHGVSRILNALDMRQWRRSWGKE